MARTAQLAILATAIFALNFICGTSPASGSSLLLAQRVNRTGIFPLAAAAMPGAQEQSSHAVLTNADVIKMAQAHLSADIIVAQIQSSSCRFSLTTNSLIALKQAGVPDDVIAAMQAKGGGAGQNGQAASAGTAHGSAAAIPGREYSIHEFERLLPGILSKAATAHGLDARSYDKETAYIDQFLDKCALDGSNLRAQMPNPRDPAYDICQRKTYQHLHIGSFLDVSLAADNSHAAAGGKGLGRGDLMMDVGQPPDRQWWPGESYTLALKVFLDWGPPQGAGSFGQFRFDDLLEGARIKGLPPKPAEASGSPAQSPAPAASGGAPGAPSAAAPATPYPVFYPSSSAKDFEQNPAYELGLLYVRRTPTVLDDPNQLRSFVGLISCADPQVARQMNSEFDAPQVLAYYRSNAATFLNNVPSTVTLRIPIRFGEYDFSNSYFPFSGNPPSQEITPLHPERIPRPTQGVSFDHVDYSANSSQYGRQCHGIQYWQMPAVDRSLTVYEVNFNPVAIDRIPMDQAAARSYIETHPTREATIVLTIDLSDDAPKVVKASGNQRAAVAFDGHVTGISLYDSYPDGKLVQTLSTGASAAAPDSPGAQPAPGGAGAQADPGTAATPSSPTGAPTTDLPVPVVHEGVAGKVLMGFVNKCSAGDSKGCEMVGYDLNKGWGADPDPQAARAYYQKACSLGRKGDCNK